jgi:serine/threonine protein kinase
MSSSPPSQDFVAADFAHYTMGKKLGAGTFGVVHVALLNDGRFVAVKQLDMDPSSTTPAVSPSQSLQAVADNAGSQKEVEIHKRLNHPNIIRYLHSCPDVRSNQDAPKLLVFLEYVTGGSVTSIMKTLPEGKLPLPVVSVYARHMLQGLEYLHDNGVAHRDIKGDNILISQDTGVAKLADFDQAKVVAGTLRSNRANTLAGTPFWIAPEVITDESGYDPFKADVWSAGCTVAEMATGKAPWVPMASPMAVMYKLANSTGWPDAVPTSVDVLGADLHSFLSLCFQRNAAARPSTTELLQHPFITKGARR